MEKIESVVFIPFANTDPEQFLSDKKFTTKQYVNMEIKEYEDHKDGVDMMMDPANDLLGKNIAINPFDKRTINVKQQSYSFFCGRCRLLTPKGQLMSMDQIKEHIKSGKKFLTILQYKKRDLEMEPDLNIEVQSWAQESKKLLDTDRLNDEEKIMHLPMKTLGIEIVVNKGMNDEEKWQLLYQKCKIVKVMGSYTSVVLLVDHIDVYVDEDEAKEKKQH